MPVGNFFYAQWPKSCDYSNQMNQLREYIDKRQTELGLSQNQVAQRAGRSNTWLNRFMSGDRKDIKVDSLIALAKALQVSELKLIAAYKGQDPDAVDDSNSKDHQILLNVAKQIPDRLILETRSDDDIFKALLASKGEDKMRELMQEAIRRKKEGKGQ